MKAVDLSTLADSIGVGFPRWAWRFATISVDARCSLPPHREGLPAPYRIGSVSASERHATVVIGATGLIERYPASLPEVGQVERPARSRPDAAAPRCGGPKDTHMRSAPEKGLS